MTQPLKPWLSFKDQLQLLQKRGLVVEDRAAALDYLERLGYYRLSGYWHSLRTIDPAASPGQSGAVRLDSFVPGSRFEDVARLYVFDKRLRLLALDALERIEMAIRVDVAHVLGERDPRAHEIPSCLHGNFSKKRIATGSDKGKTKHEVWLAKHKALLDRADKQGFVQHNTHEYGTLPIWVAAEIWDFGLLSRLFAGMKHEDQQTIASGYQAADGPMLAKWLHSLNFIRNVAAHHSRLWNINVVVRSNVPPDWSPALNDARPFFYFCLMQQLLRVICPNSTWGRRLTDLLQSDFPSFPNATLSLDDFGWVPDCWDAKPCKKQPHK